MWIPRRASWSLTWVLLAACGSAREPAGGPAPAPTVPAALPAVPAALVPTPAGRFAPSRLELAAGASVDGLHLADHETCGDCHQEVAAQWATSAHALASFTNPVYRAALDRVRAEEGGVASHACAGCHDIALLVDGAMADGQPVPASDPRAHAGVTCRLCHGIGEVRADGNSSFTLVAEPAPIPDGHDREASTRAHVAAMRAVPAGAAVCTTTCHRSFMGPDTGNQHFVGGQDDVTAWRSSAYTGNGLARIDDVVDKRDCVGCHMPPEPATLDDPAADGDGRIASHRFTGAHTWLAVMRGDDEALARTRALLRGVASIDVARAVTEVGGAAPVVTLPADGAPAPAGAALTLDVVVRNLKVGHRFPGGAIDAQDTWIEVVLRDRRGRVLAASGDGHAAADDDAHVLRAIVVGADAQPRWARQVNQFRARIADHTIAARDAVVARYHARVPARLPASAYPLAVEARLLHRSHNRELAKAACAASRGPRGREYARHAARFRVALDGCTPQPITEIARAHVELGPGARIDDARPRWRRMYEHALGLLGTLQEHLEEPRASLVAALAVQEAAGIRGRERAMVLAALARVEARVGRTESALAWADAAEREVPGAPALDRVRAEALMRVWRWDEAVAPLTRLTARAPLNLDGWSALAMTLGSVGRDREALIAAQRGLALVPRDADCLRVQAVALRALGQPDADAALAAYAEFRPADWVTELRIACANRDPACERERTPVHVHELHPRPEVRR